MNKGCRIQDPKVHMNIGLRCSVWDLIDAHRGQESRPSFVERAILAQVEREVPDEARP